MEKLTIQKVNRSAQEIQKSIIIAIEQKNWILVEQSFKRLYSLQKYLGTLLEFQSVEINNLKGLVNSLTSENEAYEKEWFEAAAKKTNNYNALKTKIDETWGWAKG